MVERSAADEEAWAGFEEPREDEKAMEWEMEPFGDYQHSAGLTFVTRAGRLRYRKTVLANRYWQFIRDVPRFEVKAYELVVTA